MTVIYGESSPILLSSTAGKTITCPVGTQVHGTGGTIVSSFGEVTFLRFEPDGTLTSVWAEAGEDGDGADFDWWFRVYAICAP